MPSRSIRSFPPIRRGSMTPRPWTGFWQGLQRCFQGKFSVDHEDAGLLPWEEAAYRRRGILLLIVAASSAFAVDLLSYAQPFEYAHPALHLLQLVLFVVLFGWVTAGFVTALMGFWVQLHPDPHALSLEMADAHNLGEDARTAIIMPICNEPPGPVFAGLRATCESLLESGHAGLFDIYVLSDTYTPSLQEEEFAAWSALREKSGKGLNLYYRRRKHRARKKAGNVADFCRRWGRNYRYMVVLDADSVMTGKTLTKLVALMESNPQAGIIQTAPRACGVTTFHARIQQFAGRVVGTLFTSGMQFWQLGESHYWGHNAIIRVEPFMNHCALARLPGSGGLSGEILSHDFVEAALMRRAGYHIWLVADLDGSYEQQPSNLIEELQRDRRWCQGNLMNFRLITEPGFQAVHRAMILTGAMAYVSAPLWLGFLLVSLALRLMEPSSGVFTFLPWLGLSASMHVLWMLTLSWLFMPRALAVIAILKQGKQAAYGGTASLIKSVLLEAILSALQAPIRMVAHTLFVLTALTGISLEWKSPDREARSVQWSDALNRFKPTMSVVFLTLLAIFLRQSNAVLWLLPIGLPLLLAPFLIVVTSQPRWGRLLRRQRWLLTPEERMTPEILTRAWTLKYE